MDRLEVYNRAGELLYENEYKDGKWQRSDKAVEVIEAERQREPTQKERDNFRSDWQRINDLMEDRKAPAKELEKAHSVYEKLERGLNKQSQRTKSPGVLRSRLQKLKESEKERSREDDLLP